MNGVRYVGNVSSSKFKRPGRPRKFDKELLARLVVWYYTYPVSVRRLAKKFGVSPMTVWRTVQDEEFVSSVLGG